MADYFRERRYLGARDRREISRMVYGTLRHGRQLDQLVQIACRQLPVPVDFTPPELSSLLVAAHEMHVEPGGAAETSAALAEYISSSLAGKLPPEFPEILLACRIPADLLGSPLTRIAMVHSFPDSIIREWIERMGAEEAEELAASLNRQAPLAIRVNTLKGTVDQCRQLLAAAGVDSVKGTCSPFALVLSKRLTLENLRPYRDGMFEMQDEGSQLLSLLVHPQPGMTVIDACAGGGGKTLHLAALMQNRGRLVAIDVDDRRLRQLAERAARAGANAQMVLSAQRDSHAIARLRGKAHAVLVDAPCSAIGTVRRNPSLKDTYTEERSVQLNARQGQLLDAGAALVMPGGRLVYSTCTLIQKENEDVVSRFLAGHPEFSLQSSAEILTRWGIAVDRSSPYLQLYPHRTGTDGFFAAVMVREEGSV